MEEVVMEEVVMGEKGNQMKRKKTDLEKTGLEISISKIALEQGAAMEYAEYLFEHRCTEEEARCFLTQHSYDKNELEKEKVNNFLYMYRKERRSLAIVVPTCDRIEEIFYWIKTVARDLYILGYDLVFYDSSTKENVCKIENYIKQEGLPNVKRVACHVKVNGVLCKKIYAAARIFVRLYDYIWFIRDRSVPNMEVVERHFQNAFKEHADFAVIYPHYLMPQFYGKEIYTDCAKLFSDFCGEMTSLGSIMFSQKTLQLLVKEYPVDRNKNYGLWLPMALFHCIADRKFKAYYFGAQTFQFLPYHGSFWIKSDSLLWLFAKRWNEMVDLLPGTYNRVKEQVRKFEGWDLPPFSFDLIIQARSQGSLGIWSILRYWKYLKKCAENKILILFAASLIPSSVFQFYSKYRENRLIKAVWLIGSFFYRILKAEYQTLNSMLHIHKKYTPYSGLDYGLYREAFAMDKDIKSILLEGKEKKERPFLSIIIPTNNRAEQFQEALRSILEQETVDYEWEVVVVDNDPYDGTCNETQKFINKLGHDRIRYFRNEKNLGAGGNMNRGAMLARGKWIAFLHDDDMMFTDYLQRIHKIISTLEKKNRRTGMIFGNMLIGNDDMYFAKNYYIWNYLCVTDPSRYEVERVSKTECIFTGDMGFKPPTCGFAYLRKAYLESGGINEKEIGFEGDFTLDYNILKKYEAYRCVKPFGLYRWGSNYSSKNVGNLSSALYDLREYIYQNNFWGNILKSILRQEHTYESWMRMKQWDASRNVPGCYGLIDYHPNWIRKLFCKTLKKSYVHWQKKHRMKCNESGQCQKRPHLHTCRKRRKICGSKYC